MALNFIRSLTLRQLQIFVVASRYTSFARAAEELHLTQPAVSMQIHQLEEAVGLRLFERIARKLALTEAGEKFSHHASRILGEIKDAEDAMTSLKQADSGSIAVGIVSSATYFAPKLLAMYSRIYPKSTFTFRSAIATRYCVCCRTTRSISRSWAGRRRSWTRRPSRSHGIRKW